MENKDKNKIDDPDEHTLDSILEVLKDVNAKKKDKKKKKYFLEKKGFIQIPLLIGIIAGILVLGGGYFGVKQYQNYQTKQIEKEKVAQETQKQKDLEVEKLRQEVEALKNKKPETITQTITKEIPAKNTEITVAEINKYITGVIKITCGNTSGSGTLAKSGVNKYLVLTNYHVVSNLSANTPCLVVVEDKNGNGLGGFMTGSTISSWNNQADVAVLDLRIWDKMPNLGEGFTSTPVENLNYNISSLQNCPEAMPVGSPVAIVGYPAYSEQQLMVGGVSMGTTLSRIVSNGIISGYDTTDLYNGSPYKNYFISAKIDSGNSGGIAFSKNENGLCNLGIPTWLTVGNYETQGIVQNIRNITNK